MKLGILNLIPKGGRDTRMLKNLRPITLLNTDYKIVEKAISNRMIPSLEEIISADQRGFIPNRRIAANIRKILDIIVCTKEEQYPGLIMSCDFMKCFDKIETDSVLKAMEYFNFSEMLRNWMRILYGEFQIRIQNNGDFSSSVKVTRSVHQGGPASNCYFLVVAELLAISLKKDNRIRGIFVKEILHLLNQYADDLDVFLSYDEDSMRAVMEKFKEVPRQHRFYPKL